MGNLCGRDNSTAYQSKLIKQLNKELTHIGEMDGLIRVTSRYHRLPVRLQDDYELTGEVLGHGASGAVYLAKSKLTGCRVAVKTLNMSNLKDKRSKEKLVTEIGIALSADHPNVVTLIDAYESEEEIHLITECMDGGNLCSLAKEEKQFSETRASAMVKQMLLAVNYFHTHGIIHRDIKLDNFLLEQPGVGTLKLIDFGLSKHIRKDEILGTPNAPGTLAYTAPEVLDGWCNNKCDMWSLGVIAFILIAGYMPFYGAQQQELCAMIRRGNPTNNGPKERWNNVTPEARDFVSRLFVKSPVDRFSAEQALAHPWIANQHECPKSSLDLTTAGFQQFASASRFRRACMLMMVWSIPASQQARLYDVFVELDHQHKGVIDIDELLGRLDLKAGQAEEARKLLGQSCGTELHYSDFVAATACTRMVDDPHVVEEAFRRFDITHSGVVGEEELQNILGNDFDCGSVLARFPDSQISIADFTRYLSTADSSPKSHMSSFACDDPISPTKRYASQIIPRQHVITV
jgi:calcium-dependent protein kinase